MYQISQEFRFEAGHRRISNLGKPKLPVGYNYHPYRVVLIVEASQLDENGMVVDFAKVKEKVGGWIKHNYDHNFLIAPDDICLGTRSVDSFESFGRSVQVCKYGPSAEGLAHELFDIARERLDIIGKVRVVSVTVWETKKSSATYREGGL